MLEEALDGEWVGDVNLPIRDSRVRSGAFLLKGNGDDVVPSRQQRRDNGASDVSIRAGYQDSHRVRVAR